MRDFHIFQGDVFEQIKNVNEQSVDCCVTSTPYWRKRDYGHPEQLGQEDTPQLFVDSLAAVFSEVRRVLKLSGTLWLNIDDSYFKGQMCGIPWRLALRLQQEGWHIRSAIIWNKVACTPEPVKNRCTHAYEYVFMLTLGAKYFYNLDAIRVPHTNPWAIDCIKKFQDNPDTPALTTNIFNKAERMAKNQHGMTRAQMGRLMNPAGKNRRDVWDINPHRERGLVHLAPYPEEIPEFAIKAGCPEEGLVMDPFSGSGTTGCVAMRLNRDYLGIELVEASVLSSNEKIKKCGGNAFFG